MAHPEQREFFERMKVRSPFSFMNVRVIDCGSLDINGSLKDMFQNVNYIGVDMLAGRNVDIVSKIHELTIKNESFDTVVSGEMLEHDCFWKLSLKKMYDLCKKGGAIIISCAGKGRKEHGTVKTIDNPMIWNESEEQYYLNKYPDVREAVRNKEFTCAFEHWIKYGRAENRETPERVFIWGTSGDYYMNIEPHHIKEVYSEDMFNETIYEENPVSCDTYFFGTKK